MKPKLFHSIGLESEESAAVRRHLVEHGLQGRVEFLNIAYEGPQKELLDKIGAVEAPVLVAGDEILRGRAAILAWLKDGLR